MSWRPVVCLSQLIVHFYTCLIQIISISMPLTTTEMFFLWSQFMWLLELLKNKLGMCAFFLCAWLLTYCMVNRVAVLAFHLALIQRPRRPVVVAAVAFAMYYATGFRKALVKARKLHEASERTSIWGELAYVSLYSCFFPD